MAIPPADTAFEQLLSYVRDERGFDFTAYKRPSLVRRITQRMHLVGTDGDYRAYQARLEAEPHEFNELFDTILINVTGFFRDRPAWDSLAADVIPRIIEEKEESAPIRVWSAGCASGEEAYSLAILLCEAVGESRFRELVKVYGTDADDRALSQARQGRYPEKALHDALDDVREQRFFEADNGNGGLAFRKDLRRSVIFGRHDLVQDPPISRIDLLVCRNTLMYFNADTQRRVLNSFHFALNEGGFLFLGKAEALVTRTTLFSLEDTKHHIFSKRAGRRERPSLPRVTPAPMAFRAGSPVLLDSAFENSPVAQMVIGRDGMLDLANRHARLMFGLGIGDVGRPLKDLELSYRPIELRSRVEQVLVERRPVTIGDVEFQLPGGSVDYLEIQFLPIGVDTAGVSLTFTQLGRHKLLRDELERAQRELETAYEELQSTVEELETTNEELQSTNEELETTNEELHSTNEELETMNEELQSINEELETINTELRDRSCDLDHANAFLHSILTSLGSGVAVLNASMAVRVWNRQAEDLWGLRADEVQDQHFLNLDIGLPVDELRPAIRACLSGKSPGEQRTLAAVNRRGRTIECRVIVSPLVDGNGSAGGVIVRMDQLDGHG